MFEKLQKIALLFKLNLSQDNKWFYLKTSNGRLLTKTQSLTTIAEDLKNRSWHFQLEKVK